MIGSVTNRVKPSCV